MEQELNNMVSAGGLFASLIMMGGLLKYILTIVFLVTGSTAFLKYINK